MPKTHARSDANDAEFTVMIADDMNGERLDKALAHSVPQSAALSRVRLLRLIGIGAVRCGERVITNPRTRVQAGDVVSIALAHDPPQTHSATNTNPQRKARVGVVYQDEHICVVNKAAGVITHAAPASGVMGGTLVDCLQHQCGAPWSHIGAPLRPGVVHRLDKDTTGLLVFARTDAAHYALAQQFAMRQSHRRYYALVYGDSAAHKPPINSKAGVIPHPQNPHHALTIHSTIARHPKQRQKQIIGQPKPLGGRGRTATTHIQRIATFGEPIFASLVVCTLDTGRTHQIRAHMAYIGCPLIGESIYTGQRPMRALAAVPAVVRNAVVGFDRQALHAQVLSFVHPHTNRALTFRVPLPHDMAALLSLVQSNVPYCTIRTPL